MKKEGATSNTCDNEENLFWLQNFREREREGEREGERELDGLCQDFFKEREPQLQ
jgi:hypothetical protein